MRRGPFLSHLLASILVGLVLAALLLGFGVIGKQRTETVPISLPGPETQPGASGSPSNVTEIFRHEASGVVLVRTRVTRRVPSPFVAVTPAPGVVSTGSGFLISRQGFILTTFHAIGGADSQKPVIIVEFDRSLRRSAEVIAESAADDVALLKVSMRGVPAQIAALPVGDSRTIDVGSTAISLANPFGEQRTVASGIISALQNRIDGIAGSQVDDVFQTDNPVNPRADGGPLLDSGGTVIGVNSEIEVPSGSAHYAVGFATPIDSVRQIIPKGVLP